jgi:hypothetical protein
MEMEFTTEDKIISMVGCGQQDTNLGCITKERMGGPGYLLSL